MEGHSKIEDWEAKADADLLANEEVLGECPPVADIQAQMWHQAREHMTYEEAMEFMHSYFPVYEHEAD